MLENLIPEAFAVVREASQRVFGMRHLTFSYSAVWLLTNAASPKCVAKAKP
ncbi:hypothetical protein ACNKHR_07525 [Shigella flexneri]